MNIVTISGSQRSGSNSKKIADLAHQYLQKNTEISNSHIISLEEHPLPLWDPRVKESQSYATWLDYEKKLELSDALVVITPEWSGMASPAIKNFFLYCNNKIIAHKPALIISVSSGIGGSYPINELRTSSYKNTRICYMPDHIILRNVESFCQNYPNQQEQHQMSLQNRFHYSLDMLMIYAKAFTTIREDKKISLEEFPNGL